MGSLSSKTYPCVFPGCPRKARYKNFICGKHPSFKVPGLLTDSDQKILSVRGEKLINGAILIIGDEALNLLMTILDRRVMHTDINKPLFIWPSSGLSKYKANDYYCDSKLTSHCGLTFIVATSNIQQRILLHYASRACAIIIATSYQTLSPDIITLLTTLKRYTSFDHQRIFFVMTKECNKSTAFTMLDQLLPNWSWQHFYRGPFARPILIEDWSKYSKMMIRLDSFLSSFRRAERHSIAVCLSGVADEAIREARYRICVHSHISKCFRPVLFNGDECGRCLKPKCQMCYAVVPKEGMFCYRHVPKIQE